MSPFCLFHYTESSFILQCVPPSVNQFHWLKLVFVPAELTTGPKGIILQCGTKFRYTKLFPAMIRDFFGD